MNGRHSLETLSDYAWRALRYLDDTPPRRHSASVIARAWEWNRGTGTVVVLLKAAEGLGLVQRTRTGTSRAWEWELTQAGCEALADRQAGTGPSMKCSFPGPEDDPSGSFP
jgi:DNA-binding MarR family transcriptional regulator